MRSARRVVWTVRADNLASPNQVRKVLRPHLRISLVPSNLFFYDLVREYLALANSEILCFLKTPAETL